MKADSSAPLVPNELAVAWDTVVAPHAAFAAVRERPRWLVAFVITCVLGMTGAILQTPAGVKIAVADAQRRIATDPNLSGMAADRQHALLDQTATIQQYAWIGFPLILIIVVALTAAVLLLARAIGKGDAGYSRLFALAAHVAIVSFGLAYLYIGLIVAIKGAAAFDSPRDLLSTLPSLAWLAPGAGTKLYAFLASFSVFAVWSAYLITLGLEIVARVSRNVALATALVLLLLSASVAALAAR